MDYFDVKGKKFLVFGVANKKSVAYFIAKGLIELGAEVILSVLNDEVKKRLKSFFLRLRYISVILKMKRI